MAVAGVPENGQYVQWTGANTITGIDNPIPGIETSITSNSDHAHMLDSEINVLESEVSSIQEQLSQIGSNGGTNITAYQFRFGSADASNDGFSNTDDEIHYNWTVNEVDPTSTTPPTEVPRGNVQATEFFNAGTGHPNGRTFTFQKGQTLIPTANGQLLFELKDIVRTIGRETVWYSVDSDRTTPIQATQAGQLPFPERINSVLLTFDLLDPVAGQSTLSLPVRLEFDTNTCLLYTSDAADE